MKHDIKNLQASIGGQVRNICNRKTPIDHCDFYLLEHC
jgi:hypothetical protein